MITLIVTLLQVDVEKKLAEAPDSGYQIGIIIGTYLPFVVLAALAYLIYFKAKNRKDLDE